MRGFWTDYVRSSPLPTTCTPNHYELTHEHTRTHAIVYAHYYHIINKKSTP